MKKAAQIMLGILLYSLALHFGHAAQRGLPYTHIILDSPITMSEARQIGQQEGEEEEPIGFCFWGEKENQKVFCKQMGTDVTLTQIVFSGNPTLVDAMPLCWQKGCLVDKQTAQELFGTASVGSQCIWHNGTSYPVLGIVDSPRSLMIISAGEEDTLDRLVLALPPEQGNMEGKQCLLRWGIQGTILDSTLILSLLHNVLLIVPFLLITLGYARFGKGWKKLSWDGILYGGQRRLLGKMTLCTVLSLGAIWILGSQLMIPKNMIPTQWSDFSFWGRWWQSEKENAIAILFTPMGNRQLQLLMNMIKSMISNLFACLVLLWPTRR